MSGELTLSQFRNTTTDNNDFVIGDPSNISNDTKYLVFQVNNVAGYSGNPHIKAEKVGANWQIFMSNDGATTLNFIYSNGDNYFTSTNTFEAPVSFLNNVTIAGSLIVGGTQLVFDDLAYLANSNTFTGTLNTFTHAATINGPIIAGNSLTVAGAVTINNNLTVNGVTAQFDVANVNIAGKNILLNNGGLTSATINAGIDIEGDGAAVVAYVRNTATSIDIKSINKQPISLVGDATYPISIAPITTLTKTGSYLLPPHTQNSSVVLTAEHVSGVNTFTSNQEVLINTDTWHVGQSGVSQTNLTALNNILPNIATTNTAQTISGDKTLSGSTVLSGTTSITGPTTFSNTVVVPTPTTTTQAANKAYVDNRVPTGTILEYAGFSAPNGFLLCLGQSVLRSTFADLFAIIGTTYGHVDGTHFNIPNKQGKVSVGANLTSYQLGTTGGEATHTLTLIEMPPHAHSYFHVQYNAGSGGSSPLCSTQGYADITSSEGSGGAHNNMQPFIAMNFMIKT